MTYAKKDLPQKAEHESARRASNEPSDPNLVTWNGRKDPSNPRNWPRRRKWTTTLISSLYAFIVAVTSSMVAPAIPSIEAEFGITTRVEGQVIFSIFVLGFAVGPLVLGPLSEIYGRVLVLQCGTTFFLVWNTACSFAKSATELAVFRFMSGLGGSAILAIGGGILADCWDADDRAHAISLFTLAPMIGPAVGPTIGGFIVANETWRWTFRATSVACAVLQAVGIFALHETHAPTLLQRKKVHIAKQTGSTALYTVHDSANFGLTKHLRLALQRPCRLVATQPIIQVMALYTAFAYGLMFLMLGIFAKPFTSPRFYNEPSGLASLNYISIGLGFTIGTQGAAPMNKMIYRWLTKENKGSSLPEFRLPLMVPGSLLIPLGLFMYGWTVQTSQSWILPNIGALIFSLGIIVIIQCCTAYVIDAYTQFAASAIASVATLRSLCGFCFPLFAPAMYATLGYGWGTSLLAFAGIGIGLPAPWLLWKYGAVLRSRSQYATG